MSDTFVQGTFNDSLPRGQTNFAWHDPASVLPASAADRLRQLQQRVEDKRNLLPDFEDRRAASESKLAADRRLQQLLGHPQEGGFNLADDHPSVVVAKRQLDQATAAAKRIDDLNTKRSAELRAASAALSNVTTWLRDGRPAGTVLEAVEIEPPKLLKGETILDAIERMRRRVRELRADQHRIRSAPFPSSYAKRKMREQIERLAQRGAPDVSTLIEHDRDIEFPTIQLRALVHNATPGAVVFHEAVDVIGLVAFLMKPTLISALDALVDTESDGDAAALSPEAREKAEAEVMADLLAVERDECALVWRAQSEGLQIEHRGDIDVRALLSVHSVVRVERASLPGTSPEHAITFIGPGG
jgi:hypothetical protein